MDRLFAVEKVLEVDGPPIAVFFDRCKIDGEALIIFFGGVAEDGYTCYLGAVEGEGDFLGFEDAGAVHCFYEVVVFVTCWGESKTAVNKSRH